MARTRFIMGAALAALAATSLAAPAAHADPSQAETDANTALNIIGGGFASAFGDPFSTLPEDCSTSNVVPFSVVNFTSEVQTGSVTIGGKLNQQVFVVGGNIGDQTCGQQEGYVGGDTTLSQDFSVPPGGVATVWMSLGGASKGPAGVFSIGGVPNGAQDPQWYDFDLTMAADGSFGGLQTYYSGTGGTDANTNTQHGFNILSCTPSSASAYSTSIMSPYSSGNANGPWYGWGAPVCMGWLPEGEMVTNSTSLSNILDVSPAVFGVNAAQYNSANQTVDVVAGLYPDYTVTDVQVLSEAGTQVSLPQSASADGYWTVSDNNGQPTLYVGNIPAFDVTQILVTATYAGVDGTMDASTIIQVPTGNGVGSGTVSLDETGATEAVTPENIPPTASDYSFSFINNFSDFLQPYAEVLSLNSAGTAAQVQLGVSLWLTDALSEQYGDGYPHVTGVQMPDGTVQSYDLWIGQDGTYSRNITVPLTNSSGQYYSGTAMFIVEITTANGTVIPIYMNVTAAPPAGDPVTS